MTKILRTRFLLPLAVACGLLLSLSGECLAGPAPLPTAEECAQLIKNSVAHGDTAGNTVSPAILRACAQAAPTPQVNKNAMTSPSAVELIASGSWNEISAAVGGSTAGTIVSPGVVHRPTPGGPTPGVRRLFVFGHGLGLSADIRDLSQPPADYPNPSNPGVATNQTGLPPSGSLPFVTANLNDQVSAQLDDDDFVLAWNGSAKGGVAFPSGRPPPAWAVQHFADWVGGTIVYGVEQLPLVAPTAPSSVTSQPAPGWFFDQTPGLPARNEFRPALALWRYTSSNGIFGFSPSAMDTATTSGIGPDFKVAHNFCPWLEPGVGGFDRPEIASDPWSAQHNRSGYPTLWLSVRCGTILSSVQPQPQPGGGYQPQSGATDDAYQLYTSTDGGLNWAPSMRVGHNEPMMMIPTESGTLFLGTQGYFTYINPALAQQGQANAVQFFSPVWPGTNAPQDPVLAGLTPGALGPNAQHICPDLGIGINVFPASMGAAGPEEALIAFPASEQTVLTKSEQIVLGEVPIRQVLVVSLVGPDAQGKPAVFFHRVIRPLSPTGSIVLFDMISEKRAVSYPANFIYWLETDRPPVFLNSPFSVGPHRLGPIEYTVRGMVLRGSDNFQGTMVNLSGPAGYNGPTGYSVQFATFLGDYVHGTSFYDAGTNTLTFVPVWPAPASNGSGNLDPYARLVSIVDSAAVPDMSKFKPQKAPRVEDRSRTMPFEHQGEAKQN